MICVIEGGPKLSQAPNSGWLHIYSDIWPLRPSVPLSSCRRTAGLSQSSSVVRGSGLVHHGPWCQVRVREFDSPRSKFTTNRDRLSLLSGSDCQFPHWAAWLNLICLNYYFFPDIFLKVGEDSFSPCSPVPGVGLWSIQRRRSTALIR